MRTGRPPRRPATPTPRRRLRSATAIILLTGAKNSPFEGSEAVSKDIAIGDPQGVTVTVEAIDAIRATEVDRNNRKYPDVYQLNEITLTATVEAAEAGSRPQADGNRCVLLCR